MKSLLLSLSLFLSVGLCAQDITRENVAHDLHRMVAAMEAYHCNAYHYVDATTIDQLLEQLVMALPEKPTAMDGYRAANLLACAFGDGHSRVWDYGIEKSYQENGGTYFPFAVDVLDGHLIVRHDYRNGTADLTGAEITAINGVGASTLIAEMSRHASRETAALDRALLSNNFRRHLWLTFPWATGDFTLTLADGSNQVVRGRTADEVTQNLPRHQARPVVETRILDENTAYLRIDHFEGRPKTFKARFRAAFAEINNAGADQLIIDLRGHGGGDSRIGLELARYFSDQPFRQFAYSQWKATPLLKENFKNLYLPKALHWALPVLKGINPHTKAIYNTPDHGLARVEYPLVQPYGKARAFNGAVILLVDNNTFSAGTCFAAMFKDYQMGTIVGQESGNLANFHADGLLRLGLLHQTLSLQISNSYLVRPSGDESPAAVQPDIALDHNLDALDYTLQHLLTKKNDGPLVR